MSSSQNYLNYILNQLAGLPEISHKTMMGEYLLYYQGKIIGGIYDDRFLIKPTPSAKSLMPEAPYELPYEGAKEMLLVTTIDNPSFLHELLNAIYPELPTPKTKKTAKTN